VSGGIIPGMPKLKRDPLPSITYREDLPSWEELVALRRQLLESRATSKHLSHELHQAHGAAIGRDELEQELNVKESARVRLAEKVNDQKAMLEEQHRIIQQLELENGTLEARHARDMGRVVVVGVQDDMATLVTALDQIRQYCEASIPPDNGAISGDPDPRLGRIRQVKGLADRALAEVRAVVEHNTRPDECKQPTTFVVDNPFVAPGVKP
jgi:hypothetical protein